VKNKIKMSKYLLNIKKETIIINKNY